MERLSGELVAGYASLFVHCWGQYAVQQGDGSYWRVAEPLTFPLLTAHLEGRWTLGTYLLDAWSCCAFAVFDADGVDGLAQLSELAGELRGQGVPTVLEASRRGGHLWVHLVEPTPAHVVRAWLLPYAIAYGVELYPKQDQLAPGGSGSLVRLPLGVHRKTRGWYPFLQLNAWGEWVPVGEMIAECCAWVCQQVQRVAVPAAVVLGCAEVSPGWSESRMAFDGEGSTLMASRRSYGSIREWCQAQEIAAVIGRYVVLDGRGIGSCPFKGHHYRGDLRPSFQVFGGSDPHWYC
jgi:TOTE conflict system, Archaeo-Eukaryotic Primase domain